MSTVTFTLRRRDLAWATALIVLLSAIWVARPDVADAGGSPTGDGIAVVYVAVGTGFPDALGVGPGAALNGAPIILVPTNPPLDPATEAELIRLDPRAVIIVGGTGVISDAMQTTLEALLPKASVERIAGTNRYKTNAAFSSLVYPVEGWASVSAPAFTGLVPATDTVAIGAGATNSTGFLYASIQLPHNARILELKAMGADADASLNMTVVLYRVATSQESLATTSSGGSPGNISFSTTSIAAGKDIVDNRFYSYQIYVTGAASNKVIRNVMVRYQLGANG